VKKRKLSGEHEANLVDAAETPPHHAMLDLGAIRLSWLAPVISIGFRYLTLSALDQHSRALDRLISLASPEKPGMSGRLSENTFAEGKTPWDFPLGGRTMLLN
jgi:hypothetical protein